MTSLLCAALAFLMLDAASLPRSVAQRSEFTRTATEEELDAILQATADADSRISRWTLGTSHEGRPIQGLKIGFSVDNTPSDRMTIIIIGGIHSGECAGKEAMCDLTREIVAGEHDAWFDHYQLIIIPSLSPDSNVRRAVDNRPGQVGPSEGMGQRPNAQGLDLNRDFMKLESPEITALVKACNDYDAVALIDLHTTNGSQHRYELTYDPPHHPLTPAPLRDFLREGLFPTLTQRVREQGYHMFYYGNFDRAHTRWLTFGFEGRYGTNYMGLRGRLGILSEAYSYASYETRIDASRVFTTETLDYLTEHHTQVAKLVDDADSPTAQAPLPMQATLAPFAEPTTILGYHPDPAPNKEDRQPHDYQVQFFGRFEPAVSVDPPTAYFVPATQSDVIALLKRHGIQISPQSPAGAGHLAQFTITACEVAEQAFQGHHMVQLEGEWDATESNESADGVWVPFDQPLGRLAAALLQPESADSVATWNVVPATSLTPGSVYPILRLENER